MKIHVDVKSSIYEGQIWRLSDSALAIKLPRVSQTKAAREWLNKHKPAGATYFSPDGKVLADQWFLPLPGFRALLGLKTKAGAV